MTTTESKLAVVLLSGGLDSATTLAIAKSQGFAPHAISFNYGQRHTFELTSAAAIAAAANVPHTVVPLDLSAPAGFGGSALTDSTIDVPHDHDPAEPGIPSTYVPARNTIFLSVALGYAEILGAFDIFLGVNSVDYSGYPDCRPEFIAAFETLANLATAAGVGGGRYHIHAPLIDMTKGEIITAGLALGVDYGLTHTCYDPDPAGRSCGTCDACQLRLQGFADAGTPDPVEYQS